MEEKKVGSFEEFHEIIVEQKKDWRHWFYRGHSDPNYQLVPKAGRPPFFSEANSDMRYFKSWKKLATPFVDRRDYTEGDWLSAAQHHGLATRLLDWSFNPLVAAFFALVDNNMPSEKYESCDAVVFAHYSTDDGLDLSITDPFEPKGIVRVKPSMSVPRILRQGGIFTLHNPPNLQLDQRLPEGEQLIRIVIDKDAKKSFAESLSHYGVNFVSLFPDLDGVSSHINWVVTHLKY